MATADPKDVRVLVAGCTGYIGRFVTKELINRGYQVVAFSREKSGVGGKKSMDVCICRSPLVFPWGVCGEVCGDVVDRGHGLPAAEGVESVAEHA